MNSVPTIGIPAIEAALSVIQGDRLWLKFGHGRFVLLRRDGDGWQAHHTKLEISQDESQAKGYSEDVRSRSRSLSLEGRSDGLAQLLSISQTEDGGIFWVPAGIDADLPLKECISEAAVISCEIDNAARAEQQQRYEWFSQVSGLSYGLQLGSGSKSVHSHIFIDAPTAINEAVRLRRLFVLALLGDPAVTRPHQPMRFPGFYRREKGNYQELLSASDARYSVAQIEAGLQAAFAALGWAYPATIGGEFWADLQRMLKRELPADEMRGKIGELLERGDSFYAEQAEAKANRQQQQRLQFAQKQLMGEFDLFEAIAQLEQQLSPTEAFNAAGHDWNFSGDNHARGRCQWHPGKTNSAWLSQVGGKWVYHCPTCTDDQPLGAFQYWLADRRGVGSMPTGSEWAKLSREWLALHGVTIPEFRNPLDRPAQAVSGEQPVEKQQTKAEWLKAQKLERDHQSYGKIAGKLDMLAHIDMKAEDYLAHIDMNAEDYKEQARKVFYEPLKHHLKYETHSQLISGFASEIQPATDGRSLIAYDCSQGTGKSNNALIPPALQTAKDGGRVLIIVPTRGLAREFKGRINERAGDDIAATHLDSNYHSAAIVVSCPESAYKFKGQTFDLIQIDEANEVLHRIESAELGNAGPQSLAAFKKLLATTPTVAIATAAMSGRTLAAVQTIGGFTPDEVQLQRRSRPATQMNVIEYGNLYHWLQQIIDALHSGKRVAIPVGSRGKGRMIDRVLRATFTNKNGLVIDGASTLQNQRTQFLADPDAFLSVAQPDWFIFTPVINSGVSIEGKHFDIQFEYATPNEGAQSISQRGERIRSAIGRDGAITERHIYFSQQGAPTLEAYPEAFDWQYWTDELEDEANAPMGAAAALAKALSAEKALSPARHDAEKFAAMRPNLPHFLASKTFEIVFKKELLHEDWERYGWNISTSPELSKDQAEQTHRLHIFCDKVRIGLIEQQGRTLKKTRTREAEGELDEIDNPFQAARAAKAQLERLLGKDYLSQQNSEFFTAWAADKSASNPGVRSIVRSQLLQIAIGDPECWQQIERMKALKFLAGKPDADSDLFWSLPELPAAARDIELVGIVARCPGVADVIGGKTEQWTNQDPQVIAAGLYLVAHRKQIAANTKKSGLVRGAKFSEWMTPAALFNKAIEVMGYKPTKDKRQGAGNRLNVYRLEVEADAISALEQLKQDGEDGLKLFRAELRAIRAQTRASIEAAAKNQVIAKALAWVSEKMGGEVEKAIAAIKRRHAVLYEDRLTKLGDALKMGAGEPPDELNQMAFLSANVAISPPPPAN